MIGEAPKSPHTGLPGWETVAEEELLTRYAALVPEGSLIVEIGGEWGRSAGAFARGAKEGVAMVTVDLFPGELLEQHRANLAEAGFGGRTQQFQADSHLALHADNLESLQHGIMLLFIDGDHSYDGVVMDIKVWTPYVPVGGIVIFHDVAQETNKTPHYLHFEVSQAITDWVNSQGDFTPVEQVDTIAVFRRVGRTVLAQAAWLSDVKEAEPLVEFDGLDQYIFPGAAQDVVAEEGELVAQFERLPDLPAVTSQLPERESKPVQEDSETGLSSASDEPPADKPRKPRKSKS